MHWDSMEFKDSRINEINELLLILFLSYEYKMCMTFEYLTV